MLSQKIKGEKVLIVVCSLSLSPMSVCLSVLVLHCLSVCLSPLSLHPPPLSLSLSLSTPLSLSLSLSCLSSPPDPPGTHNLKCSVTEKEKTKELG